MNKKELYAGFWKRFAAFLIDSVIIFVAGFMVGIVFGFWWSLTFGVAKGVETAGYFLGIIVAWLYYAIMESSPKQATLGKQAVGIKVTDMDKKRISFGKASGRHFSKFFSSFLFIGFLMIAFTKKKQGLHDIIADCLVVNSEKLE